MRARRASISAVIVAATLAFVALVATGPDEVAPPASRSPLTTPTITMITQDRR